MMQQRWWEHTLLTVAKTKTKTYGGLKALYAAAQGWDHTLLTVAKTKTKTKT